MNKISFARFAKMNNSSTGSLPGLLNINWGIPWVNTSAAASSSFLPSAETCSLLLAQMSAKLQEAAVKYAITLVELRHHESFHVAVIFAISIAAMSMFFLLLDYHVLLQQDVVVSHGKRLGRLLNRLKTLKRPPIPPFLLTNPHVQFVPFLIQGFLHNIFWRVPYERLFHATPCGKDITVVDVYPSFEEQPKPLPIVLCLAGITGNSHDLPGTTIVRRFVARWIQQYEKVLNRLGKQGNLDSEMSNNHIIQGVA